MLILTTSENGVKVARSRTIKPTFFTNEELAELTRDVRLFFVGLWGIADREGRLENRPKRIKREVFPYDDDVTTETVEEWLLVLANHKSRFVALYEVDGERYVQVKNFKKHQDIHPRETQSEIPGPPKVSLGSPKPGPAVERLEIIPLPSCTSCTSFPSEPSCTSGSPSARDLSTTTTEYVARRAKTPCGRDILTWFGVERSVAFPETMPWVTARNADGDADTFLAKLTPDAFADIRPTMAAFFVHVVAGDQGWNTPKNTTDPSFAFGSWKSGFTALREELLGVAPRPTTGEKKKAGYFDPNWRDKVNAG
jgi:hypothetical protein